MTVPIPTPILRLIHRDNLEILLRRGGLHAPLATPDDGLSYRTIHDTEIQSIRHIRQIPCGARGTVHNYVPFYFGYLSPMMFKLKTGRVAGYAEGQEPLIYLISSVQAVAAAGIPFAFSDGHGIAAYTQWYDAVDNLEKVDWGMVYQRYWSERLDDMDRQRRKQAEFLIHHFCPWSLIQEIAVIDQSVKMQIENKLAEFEGMDKPVIVRPGWYY